MIIAFLILAGLVAGLSALAYVEFKAIRRHKKTIDGLEAENKSLRNAIKDRDLAIEKMQEAYHEADKKKKSIRTGDTDADFKRSLDLLRDVPGESDTD